jgi:hypothetical protein
MAQTHLSAFKAEACQGDYKKLVVNLAAGGTDTSLIALVANKKIRVLAMWMNAGGTATDITFQSNAVAITPLMAQGVRQVTILPMNEAGWFETVAGEALKATTGAGSTTGLHILYTEI